MCSGAAGQLAGAESGNACHCEAIRICVHLSAVAALRQRYSRLLSCIETGAVRCQGSGLIAAHVAGTVHTVGQRWQCAVQLQQGTGARVGAQSILL